jgi:hypothetical protein
VAECDCLQLEEPVTAFVVAAQDCQLFADELVAATDHDRRPPGETRLRLLVTADGESSDAAAVWSQVGRGRGATIRLQVTTNKSQ